MRLRQIAFVARDLAATTDELCSVLQLDVAYRDPGVAKWGLENIVVPIGGDFLEIVSPKEDHTSAGRYLERRQGDGGAGGGTDAGADDGAIGATIAFLESAPGITGQYLPVVAP